MTDPQATITQRILELYSRDPEAPPLKGICVRVNYGNNTAEIQIGLDPSVPSHPDQYEGCAMLLKELGEALCQIAANPKAIQF